MPEITKEQLAVIEAAKAWQDNRVSDGREEQALEDAIDALPKPYVPLVSDEEGRCIRTRSTTTYEEDARDLTVLVLRKAAERLTHDDDPDARVACMLSEWADEEEKLSK